MEQQEQIQESKDLNKEQQLTEVHNVTINSEDLKKLDKAEQKKEQIKELKEKENIVIESIKKIKYNEINSDCYTEMDSYVDMVIDEISYGLICEGSGGTGKTTRVVGKVATSGKVLEYIDSFTTPTSFYIWLYEHKDDDILIIDDCAKFMSSDKILAMLKGALWHSVDNKRFVNYLTTKPLKNQQDELIPHNFEINARLIIITNYLNQNNPHLKAIISRVNYCKVDIPRQELLNILDKISDLEYQNLTITERKECLAYLTEQSSETTQDLNIRTLLKIFNFKVYSKKHNKGDLWKNLSLKLLKKDSRLLVVEELLKDNDYESESDRVKKFVELTGESEANYYRLKKIITARQKKSLEILKE